MESTPTEEGPELPPEFDNINQESQDAEKVAGFVANKEQSELKSSISKKGGNSYYYAHNYEGQNFDDEQAKKVYGDGIIHGGAPILVAKRDEAKEAKAEKQKLKKKKAGKENKANSMQSLEQMILAKRNNAAGFLNYMEQKYCQGEDEDLPDESAFEAAAANSKKRV